MEHGLFSRERESEDRVSLFFVEESRKETGPSTHRSSPCSLAVLSSPLLPAAMKTTSSSSGLTFKLHPVSERGR